ncbi:MAG: PAS domain S-box protein [Desulfobacteraceae bacterium]|nr:PAS domain S-box protein [Desulfobacteraceae bacterium]MBC2756022.1 PAS domain S-box protein [Desulfobacteraceae bacterium]
MPHPKKSDEQNYEIILRKTGLSVHREPEWRRTIIGGNHRADFFVLNKNILVSCPSGIVTLPDIKQSNALNQKVRLQGIPKEAPYVQIENYQQLQGATLDARKYFINYLKNRNHLQAVIFCNTSALFNFSIKLGKRIYSFKFDIHLASDLAEAVQLARQILASENQTPKDNLRIRKGPVSPGIIRNNNWALTLGDFSLRFELINDNIFHPVPSGYLRTEYIDPIFKLQKKVFAEMDLKDGKYYLLSNQKALKGATLKARRNFEIALRKWHKQHPLRMLIFYNTNWVLRAAINLARINAPYDVHIADDLSAALELIESAKKQGRQPATKTAGNLQDKNQNTIDELLHLLAAISWDAQDPGTIIRKVDPLHPLYPVVEAVSLIKMDIDQLLQARDNSEKALVESREKYKSILDNIEEGYYEVDLSGNITFSNPSLCTILGYPAAKLQGMNFRKFCAKDHIASIFKTFIQVYRTGQPADGIDWKLVQEDGAERFIETSISAIQDGNEKPIGFKGIVRDITQRIQSEKEKEKLESNLRHAQKMEAIGTLAGGVAHDLNNILSGLVSYPDLLLMKLPPDSPLKKPIQTIQKSGEKAAAIVQDLLTLARRGLPDLSILNLNALIEEHLNSPEYNSLLTHHPLVSVIFRPAENLLNMSASGVHISKTIMNLMTNAAEAMPKGGTITIATENQYIDTPLPGYEKIKTGEYVMLRIEDTGTGMTKEDRERIFEPFYTKKKMGKSGSGLGMAMAWGVVHDHNGYIEIKSSPDKGSAISIYFPAGNSDISTDAPNAPYDLINGKKETILVVDDIQEQRELAAQMLTQLGYTACTVSSGEEAVEYIKNNPTDMLILDMIMTPGMDGLDTYKEIIKINPGQKAIIATGYSTSDRIKQAQALGAGACLKKPYLIEGLARAVKEEIDK